jgi:hypothetical protein
MTAADIVAARPRLAAVVAATPCAYSETLSVMTGSRVFVKLENLQVTLQLGSAERRRGVIAASAGNHALGVAFHAARLGIAAVVVMPEWAPLETSGRDQIETITRHLPQAGYTVEEVAQHRVGDPDMAPGPPRRAEAPRQSRGAPRRRDSFTGSESSPSRGARSTARPTRAPRERSRSAAGTSPRPRFPATP